MNDTDRSPFDEIAEARAYAKRVMTARRCHCGAVTAHPWVAYCREHQPAGPQVRPAMQLTLGLEESGNRYPKPKRDACPWSRDRGRFDLPGSEPEEENSER